MLVSPATCRLGRERVRPSFGSTPLWASLPYSDLAGGSRRIQPLYPQRYSAPPRTAAGNFWSQSCGAPQQLLCSCSLFSLAVTLDHEEISLTPLAAARSWLSAGSGSLCKIACATEPPTLARFEIQVARDRASAVSGPEPQLGCLCVPVYKFGL